MTFTDFAFAVDELNLGIDKDIMLQIFTYLDSDNDNLLKFKDFCCLLS